MAYLSFIIESYDGLATLSSIDARQGVTQLTFFSHFAEEVTGLLHALKTEGAIDSFSPATVPPPGPGWD
jgi:hypothetical protein